MAKNNEANKNDSDKNIKKKLPRKKRGILSMSSVMLDMQNNSENIIPQSKQLIQKMQNKKPIKRRASRKAQTKICSIATLLPSLQDLEKMFDDSDNEKDKIITKTQPEKMSEDSDNEKDKNISKTQPLSLSNSLPNQNPLNEIDSYSRTFGNTSKEIPNTFNIEIIHDDNSCEDSTLATPMVNFSSLPENQRFSPLPSTSRDSNTFLENDKRLKESNGSIDNCSDEPQSDIEIVDEKWETIVINDEPMEELSKVRQDPDHTMINNPEAVIILDDYDIESKFEPPVTVDVPSVDDNCTSHIINQYSNKPIEVECEIINIDDVLAESRAILQKHRGKKSINAITNVEPPIVIDDYVSTDIIPPHNNKKPLLDNVPDSNNCSPELPKVTNVATDNTSQNNPQNILTPADLYFRNKPPDPQRTIQGEYICPNSGLKLLNMEKKINHILSVMIEKGLEGKDVSYTSLFNSLNNNNDLPLPPRPSRPETITPPRSVREPRNITENRSPNKRDCPICMEPFSGQEVIATICGHVFCKKCIEAAFRASGRKCPTCRKALKGAKSYHPLYL